MRQDSAGDPPSVYWLVHGNRLVRAAPEHVRPEVESRHMDDQLTAVDHIDKAQATLEQIPRCSATTYLDLHHLRPPADSDSDDVDADVYKRDSDDDDNALTVARALGGPAMSATADTAPSSGGLPEPESASGREPDLSSPAAASREDASTVPTQLPNASGEPVREHRARVDQRDVVPVGAVRRRTADQHGSRCASASCYYVMLTNDSTMPEDWSYDEDGMFALSERGVVLDERAAFRKDKCRELVDFFNNDVWGFDQTANMPPLNAS